MKQPLNSEANETNMIYLLILLYVLINIAFCFYEYKKRIVSPALLFSMTQLLMFVGVVYVCDFAVKSDRVLIVLYFIGYIVYISCYILSMLKYSYRNVIYIKSEHLDDIRKRKLLIMITFSCVVSVAFFARSGVNIIHVLLSNIISSGSTNISQLRKAINFTSGNGLVYQFRNFIMPLSVLYLVMFEKGRNRIIGICFAPTMLILLVGSGQRAGIVIVAVICILSMYFGRALNKKGQHIDIEDLLENSIGTRKDIKKNRRRIFILIAAFLALFIALTVMNGRNDVSGSTTKAIIDRFFNDNQYCAMLAFRYIYSQPITYGNDWYNMFADLFRKDQYTPVASIIHAQLFGSLEGTSPPCIWGSAYYNFGYIGIVFVALLAAFISRTLYISFCKKTVTNLRLLIYIGMFVLFGVWTADSPVCLINAGFSTIVVMNIYLSIRFSFGSSVTSGDQIQTNLQ